MLHGIIVNYLTVNKESSLTKDRIISNYQMVKPFCRILSDLYQWIINNKIKAAIDFELLNELRPDDTDDPKPYNQLSIVKYCEDKLKEIVAVLNAYEK